jgi:hypothetical protein
MGWLYLDPLRLPDPLASLRRRSGLPGYVRNKSGDGFSHGLQLFFYACPTGYLSRAQTRGWGRSLRHRAAETFNKCFLFVDETGTVVAGVAEYSRCSAQ